MADRARGDGCDGWDNSRCEGTPLCPPRCPRFFDSESVPVLVRPATDRDASSLVAMYEDIGWDHRTMGLPPVTSDGIEEWIVSLLREGWNLVALVEDRVVGHVGVTPTTAREPQFVVFVHQTYQNRGIGSELVKQLVAYAADREYEGVALTVSPDNPQAIDVYRNVGFEPEELETTQGIEDPYIEMRLSFPHPIAEHVRLPPAER